MGQHLLCLAAPFTFTWPAFWLFAVLFFAIGCLGIDVSFHRRVGALRLCRSQGSRIRVCSAVGRAATLRFSPKGAVSCCSLYQQAATRVPPCRQLTHHSFASPKLVEYFLAFLGTLGGEMVSECDWGGMAVSRPSCAPGGRAQRPSHDSTLQRRSQRGPPRGGPTGSLASPCDAPRTTACLQDPIDWVRHHRYHHRNCDSPLDPHSELLPCAQASSCADVVALTGGSSAERSAR